MIKTFDNFTTRRVFQLTISIVIKDIKATTRPFDRRLTVKQIDVNTKILVIVCEYGECGCKRVNVYGKLLYRYHSVSIPRPYE